MKMLVTGANGYLGVGIVKQLLDDGVEVIATDIDTDRVDCRAKRINCDLFSIEDPYNFFNHPEAVLHLAWRDGFIHNSDSHVIDLPKHYKFLSMVFQSGISRVAVMGSMHEIGFYEGCIDEMTACKPMSNYGIAKNALRFSVENFAHKYKKPYQWLRGYYIVGNTCYGSSIFSKIVVAEQEGKKSFPFTTGQNQYDFLDYDKFCYQVASAVEQAAVDGIINICSGYPEKLSERVEKFIKDNNYKIKLEYGSFPDRPYDSKAVWGNSCKIMQILKDRVE